MNFEKLYYKSLDLHKDNNDFLKQVVDDNERLRDTMKAQSKRYEAEIDVLEKRIKELERRLESATGKLRIIHSMTDQLESS